MEDNQALFNEIIEIMNRIQREFINKMRVEDYSLTKRQEAIILYIFMREDVTMSEIADYFDISRSAVSQALNKLEEQDIIVRTINKDNRREINLLPGEEGKKLQKEMERIEKMIVDKYLAKIDPVELKQVRDFFGKFEEALMEEEHNNEHQ